jgi:SRSO17 transposase
VNKTELDVLEPALLEFLEEFEGCATAPTRRLLATYLRGQLGALPRKSVKPIAREAGVAPRTLQEMLSIHRWDEDQVRHLLQRRMRRGHQGPHGVGYLHQTGLAKKGNKTPGVARQTCVATGRVRNCVSLLHLCLVEGPYRALVDSELLVPDSWKQDPGRCQAAGIPEAVVRRTWSEAALDLVDRARTSGISFGWLAIPEELGADRAFLTALSHRGQRFVPALPPDHEKRKPGIERTRVFDADPGPPEDEVRAVQAAHLGASHRFEEDKREIGLEQFEVRTYRSLKRHLILSQASLLFLAEVQERRRKEGGSDHVWPTRPREGTGPRRIVSEGEIAL